MPEGPPITPPTEAQPRPPENSTKIIPTFTVLERGAHRGELTRIIKRITNEAPTLLQKPTKLTESQLATTAAQLATEHADYYGNILTKAYEKRGKIDPDDFYIPEIRRDLKGREEPVNPDQPENSYIPNKQENDRLPGSKHTSEFLQLVARHIQSWQKDHPDQQVNLETIKQDIKNRLTELYTSTYPSTSLEAKAA